VVATPIGNLQDITLRALTCLKEADRIAAEDTRSARALLSAYGIPGAGRLVSHHANSSPKALDAVLSAVERGEKVALISEAGLPGFSDPGGELIRAALARGLPVEVLPGATAASTALVASGFLARRFSFAGFLPPKGTARARELASLCANPDPSVVYESPRRLVELLDEIARIAPTRPVCVARELTKLHQEIVRGTAMELSLRFRQSPARGEVTVVLGPAEEAPEAPPRVLTEEEIHDARKRVEQRRADGMSLREATREVAGTLGMAPNALYRALHGARERER